MRKNRILGPFRALGTGTNFSGPFLNQKFLDRAFLGPALVHPYSLLILLLTEPFHCLRNWVPLHFETVLFTNKNCLTEKGLI